MIQKEIPDRVFFCYGQRKIEYKLIFTDRKTLEIAVLPDRSVVVKAPVKSDLSLIEKTLYKRARWILRQFDYFHQFTPMTPVRQYINGETHLYIGKHYRLKFPGGMRIVSNLLGDSFMSPVKMDKIR